MRTEPARLAILDWDGVVTDVAEGLRENMMRAARWCGLPLEPFARGRRAEPYSNMREAILGIWPGIDLVRVLVFELVFTFLEYKRPHEPFPGVVEALRERQGNGVAFALCTSRDPVTLRAHLAHAGVDPRWFVKRVTGFHRPLKPDPLVLLPIFEKMHGIAREHTVLIGDTPTDWQTARGAGVPFIGVLSGLTSREGFKKSGVPDECLVGTLTEALHRFCG